MVFVKKKKLGKLDQHYVKWHVMLHGVLVRARFELSHCSGNLDVMHHDQAYHFPGQKVVCRFFCFLDTVSNQEK